MRRNTGKGLLLLAEVYTLNPAANPPRRSDAGEGRGDRASRLGRVLDLAGVEDWRAAAADLAAMRSEAPGLPACPVLDAMVFLLADRRREAIATLADAQRRDPGDLRLAHVLLLACYHTLRHARASGEVSEAEDARLAERAIANWVFLLHRDGFWTAWLEDRLGRYAERAGELGAGSLRLEILARLTAHIEGLVREGERPEELEALLRREIAAAGQLAAAGGLPLPGRSPSPLICGPLMIEALACTEAFGAFVTAFPAAGETAAERVGQFFRRLEGQEPRAARRLAREELERLRRSFSRLGMAQAFLDLERPEDAWAFLAELACPECRAGAGPAEPLEAPAGWAPFACAGTCPRFDRDNPGYAGRPDKTRLFERDALDLALAVQLALGHVRMTASEVDPAGVARCFREALLLAARTGRRESAERRIADAVLGRVKALAERASFTPAIALVEASLAVCAGTRAAAPAAAGSASEAAVAPEEDLSGQLAELLIRRGVAAGNERRWEEAVADLRRAVTLNPHSARALLNLVFALQGWARQQRRAVPSHAVELVLEAVGQLQAGLPALGGQPEVQEQLDQSRKTARDLLIGWAEDLAAAGGFEQSLQVLERGLAALAGDPALASRHREGVLRYAHYLGERGQHERAAAVLRRASCGPAAAGEDGRLR